jgi:hypothetical protein
MYEAWWIEDGFPPGELFGVGEFVKLDDYSVHNNPVRTIRWGVGARFRWIFRLEGDVSEDNLLEHEYGRDRWVFKPAQELGLYMDLQLTDHGRKVLESQ